MIDYMTKLKQSIQRSGDKSWSQSKNLMYFNDNQVLVWQTCDQCVYCFRLKDETNITNIQVLNKLDDYYLKYIPNTRHH